MPMVKCDWCDKEFYKSNVEVHRTAHNFCCGEHYNKYRKKNRNFNQGQKSPEYIKLMRFATVRKDLRLGVISISQVKRMGEKDEE